MPLGTTVTVNSESALFQRLRDRTAGQIGWERIEPSNESGFPDTYFVIHPDCGSGEGTVELKFKRVAGEPSLSGPLMRGNQKAALLEYHRMGGRRRWVLSANGAGWVRLYTTEEAVRAVLGGAEQAGLQMFLEDEFLPASLIAALRS